MHILRKHPLVVLIVMSIIIICGVWSKIIFHPNTYLLSSGGDASKNNFTPAWFVKYDEGTRFTGMHYPYGEHVVYTDNQPAISWALNLIDNNIYPIHNYTVGILNILLFVSILFGIIFLFRILTYYRLPGWYAAIMALAIGLFTPQLDRFWGHYALGYAVFIPWLWWRLIKVKENNYKLITIFFTILLITFFGFIHMYYVLIGALMVGFHACVVFIKNKRQYMQAIKLLAIAGIPLLVVMLFMFFTDPVNDRPETPYGFFRYKANFQTVFLPKHGTLTNQAKKLFHFGHADAEGYAFVGYTGFIFLFIFLFIYFKRLWYKRSVRNALLPMPGDLGAFFITGICMLLFSMTIPFNLGLEFLLDILTPLKQFRSPGRFAWVFFYIYLVGISVLIYIIHKKIQKRYPKLAIAFLSAFTILLLVEGLSWFSLTAKGIQTNNESNPYDGKNTFFADMLNGTAYSPDDFDGILFLPSIFQGSEKLYIDRTGWGNFPKAMELSYQTGLPLVSYMMSRTSQSETFNDVLIAAHPYIKVESTEGVFSLKKLVIMTTDRPKTIGENYILNHATKFSSKAGFDLYAFDMSSIKEKGPALAINDYLQVKDSLQVFTSPTGTVYQAEKPLEVLYYDSFDGQASERVFLGKGALNNKGEAVPVADFAVSISDTIWLEASCWATNDISEVAYPYLAIYYYDEAGNMVKELGISPTQTCDVMGNWVRASDNFEIYPSIKRIKVVSTDNSQAWFDELLIRHSAYNAYYQVVSDSNFVVNNFKIGK